MTHGGVWVVVLNYQGAADTIACVDSLRRHVPQARLLVVDNGSSDGLAVQMAGRDDVELLVLPQNLGYTGGNNAGLADALARGADVVCVLNNDTVAHDDFLTPLVELIAHRRAASSPVIEDSMGATWFEGGVLDSSAGDTWPRHGRPHELRPYVDGVRNSDLLTGCCLVASRSTWTHVGMFDDRFFLNFEDSEWSLRARAAGVELEVLQRAVLEHKVSRSFVGPASALGTYYYLRNALLFQRVVGGRHRRARLRWVLARAARPAAGRQLRGEGDPLAARMMLHAVVDHLRGHYGPAGERTSALAARRRVGVVADADGSRQPRNVRRLSP